MHWAWPSYEDVYGQRFSSFVFRDRISIWLDMVHFNPSALPATSSGCIKSYNLTWRARHYVIPAQPARARARERERDVEKLLSHQPPPLQSCHTLDFTVKPLKREENLTWPSLRPAVFNVQAINADTSAVQRICLLACLRVYVCMGVNWRKRGEEEEVSTLRASENSSTSDSCLFLLAAMNTCFRVFGTERNESACLCARVVVELQFAGSLTWS